MRLLFTTTGHPGHVLPLLPLARAALRAGHDVVVAGPRSRGAVVERAGLRHLPFDDQPEDEAWAVTWSTFELPPDEANARVIGELFGRIDTRAALPGLLEIVEDVRPDVIVRETYELAAVLAAERHGIPHVRVATGLASWEERVLEMTAGPVAEVGAELGLRGDGLPDAPYVSLTPPALDGPAAAHRFRDVPGASGELPDWWPGSADPLVYVSFGSVAGALPFFPGLYRAAAGALGGERVRVLLTIGDAGDPAELGPLPANVHVERWVPQADVLAHAAAMLSHGGYGSTTGALAAGVPLVVLPLFADQMHNAERVAGVGAGIALPGFPSLRAAVEEGPAALAALPHALARVLGDAAYARAAGRVAAGVRALPPVDEAVDLLSALPGAAAATPA